MLRSLIKPQNTFLLHNDRDFYSIKKLADISYPGSLIWFFPFPKKVFHMGISLINGVLGSFADCRGARKSRDRPDIILAGYPALVIARIPTC